MEVMLITDKAKLNDSVLENQLFAPSLKGVIDFGCAELAQRCARFFAPFRVRANEENHIKQLEFRKLNQHFKIWQKNL